MIESEAAIRVADTLGRRDLWNRADRHRRKADPERTFNLFAREASTVSGISLPLPPSGRSSHHAI